MINVEGLEIEDRLMQDEKELLGKDPSQLRNFYAVTGTPRAEYVIELARAEAERIRIVRQAQADGLLAIRKAEAEGLRLIGDAIAKVDRPELVMQLAGLMALQQVAKELANGKATKLFLPQSVGDIFSLVGAWKEVLGEGTRSAES